MQRHKKLSARILSMALTVAMVATMMPSTAFAAEGNVPLGASSVGTIQSFEKLEDRFVPSTGEGASKDVYALNVELNTPVEDLNLPDELTAMVARTTTVTKPAEDETVPDEETATTIVEQQAIPVTWNSDKEYKSDENGKFIYTAVIPEDYILADGVELPQIYVMVGRQARNGSVSQRTTTLNLKTISENDTMGATCSNGVYTHASEGWTYDTTESVPVLTLNGVDFNISSGNGVVIPASITIVIADGTTNSIKTSDASGYGKSAIYIDPDQAGDTGTVTIKCDEASLNSLNLEGIFSGIQTMNGNETVVIENVNMKLKAKDNACYVAGFRMNSGTIWATSENYGALYILKSAITLPVGSTIVGSKDANVEDSALTAAALSSDSKKIKMGADGTGDEAKTVKITPPSTTAVAFSTLTANGTANTTDTTELTLTFDKDIANLAVADITVTGATKGTLTKESGTGIYKLAISNITVAEGATVNVAVAKTGFTFTPANKDVAVHKAPSSYVCEINSTGYPTLKDAFAAATDGQTVKVTADHTFTASDKVVIDGDKSVTLNLNNCTVTSTNGTNTAAFTLKDSASLTVVGPGTLEGNGKGERTGRLIDVIGSGTITIASGTLTTDGERAIFCPSNSTGNIRISGGTLSTTNSSTSGLVQNLGSGDIVMTDGTIETAGDGAIWGSTITVSSGKVSSSKSEGSAIVASDTGKITISGTAEITSSCAPDAFCGTIMIAPIPTTPSIVLEITGTAKVRNNATPEGYSVNFFMPSVTAANISSYYLQGADATVGLIKPSYPSSKATVTITADNKRVYVGDAKPALTYTVTGIASGDALTTEPTLEYEFEPDMSKAGSVKIKAKDAVVPNTGNYESAIIYVDGTLTISTKSSGGGGGGGESSSTPPSGGSAGGVATPGKTVIDNPVGNQGSKNTLAEAVKNAIATGTTNPTVYTNFANYTALTKDGLKAINDATAAAVAGKNVQLSTKVQLDNKVGNAVISRITVDPVKLATVMPDKLGLGVWFDQKQDRQVTTVTNLFEKAFDNKIVTITFEQQSPLAVSMEFAAKPDLSALNTKSLYFYSYDPAKNIYNRIAAPYYWVDKNGYSHITAPLGGSIIITDKPLTKR